MKVLVAHNYYQVAGGEDRVFLNEKALLERHGHEVIEYVRHNSQIGASGIRDYVTLPARAVWNWNSHAELKSVLQKHKPDVAHFHNIFPLISPAAYSACWECNVPVVQSLHNSRLICPGGGLYYDGGYCQDCVGKSFPWPGVKRACYRNSHLQTAVVGIMTAVHAKRGTWRDLISRYIVFSSFFRSKFIEAGFPAEKLVIKPHFTEDPGVSTSSPRGYALYVGRLTEHKGVPTMMRAWEQLGQIPLKICGSGDLSPRVAELAAKSGGNIEIIPSLPHEQIYELIKGAAFLVWPSEVCETFGLVALESFACGVPVVSSGMGAMPDLVIDNETGLTFTAGDAADLANKVRWAWENPAEMARMGLIARSRYETDYTEGPNHDRVIQIYRDAIEQRKADAHKRPQLSEAV